MLDQIAPTIKVVIIEDQRRIREGLEALIDGTEGYGCTGAFRSMEEALARPWTEIPDVALVDIGLPGMSGIEGLRLLREYYPSTVLVMLTVYEDDERIFEALCAGASGYLLKKRFHCEIRLNTRRTASGAVRSISELRRDAKQLGNESGLADCILFGHPSRSALPNHIHLWFSQNPQAWRINDFHPNS